MDCVSIADLDGTPHAVAFSGTEPKTIRLTLAAGETVAPHDHPGRTILFHCIDGEITLELGGDVHSLSAGDLARFDGAQRISPTAETDATALVVLSDGTV